MTDENRPDTTLDDLPLFKATADPAALPAGLVPEAGTSAPRRRNDDAPAPASAPAASQPADESDDDVDWSLVGAFRALVSDRLTRSIEADPSLDGQTRLEVGRMHIMDVIRSHVDELVRAGEAVWTESHQSAMAKAIYDSLFGLGRLQRLVDDPLVENIDVYGHDVVFADYGGGDFRRMPPVASSDAELIADIQFLASRDGERGRPFSSAQPLLNMSLPGGERLAAVHPPISPRPKIVIRKHRLVDITLDTLVENDTLTQEMADFLTAAVRARKSIVVSGHAGAGKTTLLRALCNVLDPHEPIATIENERELHLDRMPGRHFIVTPLEYRPGQGERGADGRSPGEVTLEELLVHSLRLNTQRIVVGEVRGGEIGAMFQAMQSGAGSLSTLHADSPHNAIERMATLAQLTMSATDTYAYQQIGQHIDFVVQLSNHVDGQRMLRRYVTDIAELVPGESARPLAAPIFRAVRGQRHAVPVGQPQPMTLEDLEAVGFEADWISHGARG